MANPLIRKAPKMTGKTTGGHKSAGILDDHAVRKNIATREGTIEHTPTQPNHIIPMGFSDGRYVNITGDTMTGDLTLTGATTHLLLPQVNDAVTPTLAFGDGDTGFYEYSDGQLRLALEGSHKWTWVGSNFYGSNSQSPMLINAGSSATVPRIIVNHADTNTGLGQNAIDSLSLIAGGVNGIEIWETGGFARVGFGTTTPASIFHVYRGASGFSPSANTNILFEDNTHQYIQLLSQVYNLHPRE